MWENYFAAREVLSGLRRVQLSPRLGSQQEDHAETLERPHSDHGPKRVRQDHPHSGPGISVVRENIPHMDTREFRRQDAIANAFHRLKKASAHVTLASKESEVVVTRLKYHTLVRPLTILVVSNHRCARGHGLDAPFPQCPIACDVWALLPF